MLKISLMRWNSTRPNPGSRHDKSPRASRSSPARISLVGRSARLIATNCSRQIAADDQRGQAEQPGNVVPHRRQQCRRLRRHGKASRNSCPGRRRGARHRRGRRAARRPAEENQACGALSSGPTPTQLDRPTLPSGSIYCMHWPALWTRSATGVQSGNCRCRAVSDSMRNNWFCSSLTTMSAASSLAFRASRNVPSSASAAETRKQASATATTLSVSDHLRSRPGDATDSIATRESSTAKGHSGPPCYTRPRGKGKQPAHRQAICPGRNRGDATARPAADAGRTSRHA